MAALRKLVSVFQAAARHQCSYLINMHVDEFLKTGGIAEWLNGLEYVPQRLRNLNEINKLLAHRPWLITKEHIQVRDFCTGSEVCLKLESS